MHLQGCSVGMTGMLLCWGHTDVMSAVGITHRCCWRGGALAGMFCWEHGNVVLGSQNCYLSCWHHTQMLLERRCICRHVLLGVWGCCVGVTELLPQLLASCICCWRGAFTRCSVGMTGMLLYWGHRDVSCWLQADAVVSFVSSVHWMTGMLHQLQLF